MSSSSPLDETLRVVTRRYRLPLMPARYPDLQDTDLQDSERQEPSTATAIALTIEQARLAKARGDVPDEALKRHFMETLGRMIHEAMREDRGDPAFQAMVLRHRTAQVREYASLSAHAARDRRSVHATVNAIAHPGKQHRLPQGPLRDALAQLHAAAASASWSALHETANHLLEISGTARESPIAPGLAQLLDSPALGRLQRLEALASEERVLEYQSLWDRHGPRSGSHAAAARGSSSKQRGEAVEALAAQALEALARRLNEAADAGAPYCVVTSMRVPATIPADSDRAKSEWDAVLLRQATATETGADWDVCLLVEAKASLDAATTDLPRLLRGLKLLAHAEQDRVYPFQTQQGVVHVHGASLKALDLDQADLARTVLYCCDAPAEATPRLLSAASRMQLLTAPASLEFARKLAENELADVQVLEPVWCQLLDSPRWGAVLNQYPMLRQVRELMVHVEDLQSAVRARAIPNLGDAHR